MQNQTKQKVAYFSMEIALANDIHTYSGASASSQATR